MLISKKWWLKTRLDARLGGKTWYQFDGLSAIYIRRGAKSDDV